MNIVDRFIEMLSPEWAYKRMQWRQGIDAIRNYESARIDRLNSWTPVNASAEATDAPYRDLLRARARALERNSDTAGAALGAVLRNVIGTGIRPQARIKKGDEYDEELNQRLEDLWEEWTRPGRCDVSGINTFYELQSLFLRRRIVDGEVFCVLITTKDGEFKLQMIEPEQLDSSKVEEREGNVIVSGVEVDPYSRPIAYWFKSHKPGGFMSFDSVRVPAEQVLHLFTKTRANQVRGVSEFARVIRRMHETGEYLDAELVAAKIAASYALFVRKQSPSAAMGRRPTDAEGRRINRIEPGLIEYLEPGEDITVAAPGRNTTTVKDFVEIEDRRVGADLGISYELLSRDMSKATYSSARQGHLEDRKTFATFQQYMKDHFCVPVWNEFIKHCVLTGAVEIPDFFTRPDRYLDCDWIAPGWQWIDPLKDVKARREEIESGMTTLAQTCAEQGKDWQEQLEQLAREKRYAESLGLQLGIGKGSGTVGWQEEPEE